MAAACKIKSCCVTIGVGCATVRDGGISKNGPPQKMFSVRLALPLHNYTGFHGKEKQLDSTQFRFFYIIFYNILQFFFSGPSIYKPIHAFLLVALLYVHCTVILNSKYNNHISKGTS